MSCTTVKKMRQALKLMPTNLSEAYESTLKRILEQAQNRSDLAIRIIGWVSHAERNLKVDELKHALAVEKGAHSIDEEDLTSTKIILQVCIGLLIFDSESGTFRFIHYTAHEYFRQLHQQFAGIQLDIAETCLTYLTYQSICEGPCSTVEALRRRYESMPLLSYAAQCWGHHAVKVEREMGAQILQALKHDSIRPSSFQALQYRELNKADLAAALFESLPAGLKPLHVAAYWNLSLTGKVLLEDGADANISDKIRWTALHWASSRGSGAMVETLLEYQVDINARDFSGWTPLFWAAIKGHEQIVRRLLEKKADHLLMDSNGWTCLHWAASKGNSSITQVLLDHHANFTASQPSSKIWVRDLTVADAQRICQPHTKSNAKTALEIAAERGDITTFDAILEDLSTRGNSHSFNKVWTQRGWDNPRVNVPWRIMAKEDYSDSKGLKRWDIEKEYGSPKNWKTKLVHGAIRDGKVLVVELLVKLGADIKNEYDSKTPLEHAALLEDPSIATILLSNGAHDTQAYRDGSHYQHPLELAIAHGFIRTAEVLIQGGFDVKWKRKDGENLLFLACGVSSENDDNAIKSLPMTMVKMLVRYGADVHTTDESGQNALHIALGANKPDIQIVEFLLDAGVDINAKDSSGSTPFHCLCKISRYKRYSKSEEMLTLMLSHLPPGAENECQSQDIWDEEIVETPLAMAVEAENWPIFNLLSERRAVFHTTRPLDRLLTKSAWFWALQPKAVKVLLEAGASATAMDYGSTPSGHTALEGLFNDNLLAPASFEDFRSILDMFLAHGLDVNAVDSDGHTLLQVEVSKAPPTHEKALTQYLLDIGIDPYQAVHEAWDAFLLAAIHNRLDALRILIVHATRVHTSPNHWLSISQTFLDKKPLTNEALLALITSSLSRARLLESPAGDSSTPLQKAVKLKNSAFVAALLMHGANMNVTDKYGWTLLHTAAYNNDLSIVTLLLDHGADPNAKTAQWADGSQRPSGLSKEMKWAGTSLHVAAMVGASALMPLLLKHGADPNADTGVEHHSYDRGHGPSALDIALDTGVFYGERETLGKAMLSVAELVVEHGAKVEGKATHLNATQVCRFEGFSALWEKLRNGIGKTEGKWIMCNDPTLSTFGDDLDVGGTNETDGSSKHHDSHDGNTEQEADLAPAPKITEPTPWLIGAVAASEETPAVGLLSIRIVMDTQICLQPAPPPWIRRALSELQEKYPGSLLEPSMRYAEITWGDLRIVSRHSLPIPSDAGFMYFPCIRCLDCPGKFYWPGPGKSVGNFEGHCKNSIHVAKVEDRIGRSLKSP